MSNLSLRECIRTLIRQDQRVINEMAAARKGRADDWIKAVDVLNVYLLDLDKEFVVESAAKSGSTAADVTGYIVDSSTKKRITQNLSLEIKSFGSDTQFKIEITNPDLATRKAVLRDDADIGTQEDIENQLRYKLELAGGPSLIKQVEKALSDTAITKIHGMFKISGSGEPRGVRVIAGDIGDWTRVRAVGSSNTARPFYTVPDITVRSAEKDKYYTSDIEQAIQDDFSHSDDVLIICGPNCSTIRCFSLTSNAQSAFQFPMFASNGYTIKPKSAYAGSFGGGGRIGLTVQLMKDSGTVISVS